MSRHTVGLESALLDRSVRITPSMQRRITRAYLFGVMEGVKGYTYPLPPNHQPTLPDVVKGASR